MINTNVKKKKFSDKIIIGALLIFGIIMWMSYRFAIANKTISDFTTLMIEIVIVVIMLLLAIISALIWKKKDFPPQKALLFVTPIFCLIFSIVMPLGKGHDEYMHWIKAYEVSEGTLVTPIYENHALTYLPYEVGNILVEREPGVIKYTDNTFMLNHEINENERVYGDNHNAATYCFVQYIPQAVGIMIGRCITKVPALLVHSGRLCNMLTCITLMYFAIKNIPFGKNILLALSIIPITIEGFATLSADGITIAIACFFIAYAFKMAFDEKQRCDTKQVITLAISGGILALCKFVYLPIVFLVLLIPKEKFQNKKEKMISVTIVLLVAIVLNLIWLCYGSIALAKTDNTGLMPKIMQVITNPIGYIEKMIYTISQNFNQYFLSAFGGQLEWNEQVKLNVIPYMLLSLMGIATIGDKKLKNRFTRNQNILILLIILAITGLIFTSIFLQWTTDETQINGVQGRYFLPILPLILFLIGNMKLQASYHEEKMTKMITMIGYAVAICVAIAVMANHI